MLACFDTFYGHGLFATHHIEYARQVMADWRRLNKDPGFALDIREDATDNISRLFLRLDLQATTFLGVGRKSSYSTFDTTPLPRPIKATFADLNEAKYFGHLIVTKGFNFHLKRFHLKHTAAHLIPQDVLEQRDYFVQQVYEFERALGPILRSSRASSFQNQHPLAKPEALKLYPVMVAV
jgi:hypothetical protein